MAKDERMAVVTADVSLIAERAGTGGVEAACRVAFTELLRRYGDIGGVFSWNGAVPDADEQVPPPALRLELSLAEGRVTGTITLLGPDLEAVPPDNSAAHYLTLLMAASDAPGELGAVNVLTAAERREIAATDGEPLAADELRPWPDLVAEHAARHPHAIAVRFEDLVLSYGDLERHANQLAALLRTSGIGPGAAVALCMPRCERMVVAVLGILKAGDHYVPIDPADPAARRDEILRDSGARVVVTTGTLSDLPRGVASVQLDAQFTSLADHPVSPPAVPLSGGDVAYLLYTSGSTGRPKGVLVEHRQLAAYVMAMVRRFGIDRPRSYALVQPLTVDSSVTSLAVALGTGGEVHVLSRERALDGAAFADWMRRHEVDFLKIAPSHLRALQHSPRFSELLPSWLLVVGGEASNWRWLRDLQRACPHLGVVNHYGPTETTVGVLTLAVVEHLDALWSTAPIGTALPGTTVTVADPAGREVPLGIAGELVIGGAQVARGYRGVTAGSAFVETGAGRQYRTGDRVRRIAGGVIAFLGRDDDQVKVSGFRVELGEVDAALADHPAVREVASVTRADDRGGGDIVAYVVPSDVDVEDIREHARLRLPPHMVPRAFVSVDYLPLTAHGKLDRGALPRLASRAPGWPGPGAGAPEPGLEGIVAAAWRDLLGVQAVGPEQNFFDVGGHSLLLIELQNRLSRDAGRPVDLLDLLQHPTVRAQAQLLSRPRDAVPVPRHSALQERMARRRRLSRGKGVVDE